MPKASVLIEAKTDMGMNLWMGQLGHALVLISFVTALTGALAHLWTLRSSDPAMPSGQPALARLGSALYGVHLLAVLGVVGVLFGMIYTHQYQYHYVWAHSSRILPTQYMVSCFWEGQEGSFLLWIFWNALAGLWLLRARSVPGHGAMMAAFLAVQAVLCSMLLGIEVFPGAIVGSSPFMLLREAMPDLPVFAINPDYIPEDGRGLNPLLQNYWMVIHPPTLFAGFALAGLPFAMALGGLWSRHFTGWLSKGQNVLLVATAVLGTGILMGAYWAYETLNFGGYWNWDPVENAVYIPWLILVAAVHAIRLRQGQRQYLGAVYALVLGAFVLILYSTFLTRSGILGETSVHSFTDLGLSGQLLVFLLGFLLLSAVLLISRWRALSPSKAVTDPSDESMARANWMLAGILLLLLASVQVLATTSIPVANAVGKWIGVGGHAAPPADAIGHYTQWQAAFFGCILVVSVLAQLLWILPRKRKPLTGWGVNVAIATLLMTSAYLASTSWEHWSYPMIFAAGAFGMLGSFAQMILLGRTPGYRLGGALAHAGLAVMVIGILFSAGYSRVISLNRSGLVYRKDFSTEMNRDNVLLWRQKPTTMDKYQIVYRGPRVELEDGRLVNIDSLYVPNPGAREALVIGHLHDAKGEVIYHRGDTVTLRPENTYYEVGYRDTGTGTTYTLYPRAQVNESMGGLLASPDIRMGALSDLYTHVSSIPPPDQEPEWALVDTQYVAVGDTFFSGDFVSRVEYARPLKRVPQLGDDHFDAAMEVGVRIFGAGGQSFLARPVFLIAGNQVGRIPSAVNDLGIQLVVEDVDPAKGRFLIGGYNRQQDWIIMKAVEKPLIVLVWGGGLMMIAGFFLSIRSRRKKSSHPDYPAGHRQRGHKRRGQTFPTPQTV